MILLIFTKNYIFIINQIQIIKMYIWIEFQALKF